LPQLAQNFAARELRLPHSPRSCRPMHQRPPPSAERATVILLVIVLRGVPELADALANNRYFGSGRLENQNDDHQDDPEFDGTQRSESSK
jgi:hypothetical protein